MAKKTGFAVIILLALCSYNLFAQNISLDEVLGNIISEMKKAVPKETKIAVLSIKSDSKDVSDFIVNELIVKLVSTHLFKVVPRSEVELQAAQNEFDFQMSGSVSDESARSLVQF
jgi:TolB-like protein